MDLSSRLDVAKAVAREAGQILLDKLGNAAVTRKSSYNLVTDADLSAEEHICSRIQQAFPKDRLYREEGASSGPLDSETIWIIDPLDGTNNFAHGIPQFSVSVAFATSSRIRIGVVYDPMRDELFWASTEQDGCFLNEQPIAVSRNSFLKDSIVGVGFYYDRGPMMRRTLEAIERLFEVPIQGIRRFGSAALDICWVAAGRFDGYFEYQLSPWDYAAAWLILEKAGGAISDREGNTFLLESGNVITSNSQVHLELIEAVRWC